MSAIATKGTSTMKNDRRRLSADIRKEQILAAAFKYARKVGYDNLTRDAVAEFAGVSTGQVTRIFGSVDRMRDDVISHAVAAVQAGDSSKATLAIVARGLVIGNRSARNADYDVKEKALTAAII